MATPGDFNPVNALSSGWATGLASVRARDQSILDRLRAEALRRAMRDEEEARLRALQEADAQAPRPGFVIERALPVPFEEVERKTRADMAESRATAAENLERMRAMGGAPEVRAPYRPPIPIDQLLGSTRYGFEKGAPFLEPNRVGADIGMYAELLKAPEDKAREQAERERRMAGQERARVAEHELALQKIKNMAAFRPIEEEERLEKAKAGAAMGEKLIDLAGKLVPSLLRPTGGIGGLAGGKQIRSEASEKHDAYRDVQAFGASADEVIKDAMDLLAPKDEKLPASPKYPDRYKYDLNALTGGLAPVLAPTKGLGSTRTAETRQRIAELQNKIMLTYIAALKRQSSTGATGFGQLSEKEGAALKGAIANLETGRDIAGLVGALTRVGRVMRGLKDSNIKSYGAKFGVPLTVVDPDTAPDVDYLLPPPPPPLPSAIPAPGVSPLQAIISAIMGQHPQAAISAPALSATDPDQWQEILAAQLRQAAQAAAPAGAPATPATTTARTATKQEVQDTMRKRGWSEQQVLDFMAANNITLI